MGKMMLAPHMAQIILSLFHSLRRKVSHVGDLR
jgi:hypothetical protein